MTTGNSLIIAAEAPAVAQSPAAAAVPRQRLLRSPLRSNPRLSLRLAVGLDRNAACVSVGHSQRTGHCAVDGGYSGRALDWSRRRNLADRSVRGGECRHHGVRPVVRDHVHAQAIYDRRRDRDDVLRVPLPLRTEPAYALCVACPSGNRRRMPSADADHRGAALPSAQGEALRTRRVRAHRDLRTGARHTARRVVDRVCRLANGLLANRAAWHRQLRGDPAGTSGRSAQTRTTRGIQLDRLSDGISGRRHARDRPSARRSS